MEQSKISVLAKTTTQLNSEWFAEMRRLTKWGFEQGLLSAPRPSWDELQEAAQRAKVPRVG